MRWLTAKQRSRTCARNGASENRRPCPRAGGVLPARKNSRHFGGGFAPLRQSGSALNERLRPQREMFALIVPSEPPSPHSVPAAAHSGLAVLLALAAGAALR